MKLDEIKDRIAIYLDDAFLNALRNRTECIHSKDDKKIKFYQGKLVALVEITEFLDHISKEFSE